MKEPPARELKGLASNDPPSSMWPRTDWSGLNRAAARPGNEIEQLDQLLRKYAHPMKVFLLSEFPNLKEQTDDLLQEFASNRILKEGWLNRADKTRGRFRDFLKTSLRNFAKDCLRRNKNAPTSLDELELDLPAPESVESFDLAWTRAVLAETLSRMEADSLSARRNQPNRPQIWEIFKLRLAQPLLQGLPPVGYEELVMRCGIKSPAEAQNLLATAKRMFIRHFNDIVAEYEGASPATRAEMEDLKGFVSKMAGTKTN